MKHWLKWLGLAVVGLAVLAGPICFLFVVAHTVRGQAGSSACEWEPNAVRLALTETAIRLPLAEHWDGLAAALRARTDPRGAALRRSAIQNVWAMITNQSSQENRVDGASDSRRKDGKEGDSSSTKGRKYGWDACTWDSFSFGVQKPWAGPTPAQVWWDALGARMHKAHSRYGGHRTLEASCFIYTWEIPDSVGE